MKYLILTFLLLVSQLIIGQRLTRQEKKVIAAVERNTQEGLTFLEKIVNINSGTNNHEGVRVVGDEFSKAFEAIGFETRWIDMPDSVNRAGHFFAERKGTRGKRILVIGHLDTVFEEDSPFQQWRVQGDSIAYGPGANDMKGGDVLVLYALKALQEVGVLDGSQVIIAFTGDEEKTGKPLSISRHHLIEAAQRSDIALGFETSTGFGYATVARRGSSGWRLDVKGKRAHSSGVFSDRVGAGAVFEMSRILNAFYEEVRGEQYLTFNPGVVLGGTEVDYDPSLNRGTAFGKTNVVAQSVTVHGGLRFISETQKEDARAKMKAIVSQNLPNTSATITFTDSYPAMGPTDGNHALLGLLNQVSLDLGQGEVKAYDPGRRGAADISFIAQYVDGLDGLGTMGRGAHTTNEYMDLRTFEDLTKRAALLIYRLTNTD